jgi:FtsZ-binding cell division protein ZapB
MDQKVVHKLEQKIEEAITEVIMFQMGLKNLPYLPPQPIM